MMMAVRNWFTSVFVRTREASAPPVSPLPARHVETDRLFQEQLARLVAVNSERQTKTTARDTRKKLDSIDTGMMAALGLKS